MGTINHVKSITVADNAQTDLIRPSDWNSVHAYTLQDAVSISGNNTAGVLANISSGTCYLAGGNNVTLSQNGNTISFVGMPGLVSQWPDMLPASTVASTYYSGSTSQGAGGNSTQSGYTFSIYVVPLILPCPVVFSAIRFPVSYTTAGGTGSVTNVFSLGFYTNNASTLSLVEDYYGGLFFSENSSTAWTYSLWTCSTGGATTGAGGFAGLAVSSYASSQGNAQAAGATWNQLEGSYKNMLVFNGTMTTLTEGQYWFAYANKVVTSNSNVLSLVGVMQSNAISSSCLMDLGASTGQTIASLAGWGAISTTFTSHNNAATWFPLPGGINLANLSSTSSAWQRFHFPIFRGV